MHIEVSPQVIYVCRGPLAQLLVSEVVWLRAYGLLKTFAKTFNRSFLSFKLFVIVPFHFRGLNYLGFVDLGSTVCVSDIAVDKQYRNLVFSLSLNISPLFFTPPNLRYLYLNVDLLVTAEAVGRTSRVQSWKCPCLAAVERSIVNSH